MSRYSFANEYDLELSHEMERQLDRNEEREPYGRYSSRPRRRRSRYFSRLMFRPAIADDAQDDVDTKEAA